MATAWATLASSQASTDLAPASSEAVVVRGLISRPEPPAIAVEPLDQTAYPGATVLFSVEATGTEPLYYQWQMGGERLPGATNAALSLPEVQPGDAGGYQVIITNAYGSVTSAVAVLVVYSAPVILRQPQSAAAVAGSNVLFRVGAEGAPPLFYQWQFNGAGLAEQTNAVLLLTNVQAANEGQYRVALSNAYGIVLSDPAVLRLVDYIEDHAHFQVNALTTAGSYAREHAHLTGQHRGGIAASASSLFVTGGGDDDLPEGVTALFPLGTLGGGVALDPGYSLLASDLRTERVYALGYGDDPLDRNGGTVTTLLGIDGETGQLNGQRVDLTMPIDARYNTGLFAGYGQIVVLNLFNQVYSIQLPSGFVSHLGQMNSFSRMVTYYGFWGIAEKTNGVTSLVFVQDTQSIVRRRVPDGLRTTVLTDNSDYGFGLMDSITASPRFGRWYFHHWSWSVFRNRQDNIDQTVGYANAAFTVDSGIYPVRYEWGPLDTLQPAHAPVAVTLTAQTTSRGPAAALNGVVRLSASTPDGQPIAIVPTLASNFVEGTWTGTVTFLEPASNVVLRAEDDLGLIGLTAPLDVSTNDFGVFVYATPEPVSIQQLLTYSIRVVNASPDAATGVRLTNVLPAQVTLVGAASSQGACTPAGDRIVCDLGTLPERAVATVTVQVIPAVAGMLTNAARITRNEPDANPANNEAVVISTVTDPPLAVDDLTIGEGDTGTTNAEFTVWLAYPTTNTVTVQCATANRSAGALDVTATSGTLTFPPNVTTQMFTVPIRGDVRHETHETFLVQLRNPSQAILGDAQAVGTIADNDAPPTLTVADVALTEGDSGTNQLTFSVKLSAVTGLPTPVRYATSNVTATAGVDYLPQAGEVVFMADLPSLTRIINVPVLGDTRAEPDETLVFHLLGASNAVIATSQAIGTIRDNDIRFAWEPIASPQVLGDPVPVTLSARYHDDTLVTTFDGTVSLSALVPSPQVEGRMAGDLVAMGCQGGADYTIGADVVFTEDVRVTHVRHISGVKVTIWDSAGRVVLSQNVASTQGVWRETPVPVPVTLRAGQSYRVAAYTGAEGSFCYAYPWTNTFAHGSIETQYYQMGDAYPNNSLGGSEVFYMVDLVYLAGQPPTPVAVDPGVSASFVNGVWSGEVTFLQAATNVMLRAQDAAGHSGDSNPLDVMEGVAADLDMAMLASANPVAAGSPVVFKLYVANYGPWDATNVVLTNGLPAGLTFQSAWASQGSVTNDGGTLRIDLGTLAGGEGALVVTEFVADQEGAFTNTATVGSAVADPDPANNAVEIVLLVCSDCDEDGIPDTWERLYGLNPADPGDAAGDGDGDGLTNLEEYQHGTNPAVSDLPVILASPEDQRGHSGDTFTFAVVAEGTPPMAYEWYHAANRMAGETNATLALSNVSFGAIGNYYAVASNPYGRATSGVARLILDEDLTFRILDLSPDEALAVDVNNLIGDDRGGIAVSSNRVFLTGDSGTGVWDASTLGEGVAVGTRHDALAADLRTAKVYTLVQGDVPMTGAGTVDALVEIEETKGGLTTNRIDLSAPVALGYGSGIFAGYGCVVLFDNSRSRVHHIALPSGTVSGLGEMPFPSHQGTESWAFWGIAEYLDGVVFLVHVRNSQAIVRTRVPDGLTTVVREFADLSDMASITFSTSRSRWFFHHEGYSQFFSGSEALGSAGARYTTDPGYPLIRGLEGDPVVNQGTRATFRVDAVGSPPLRYQWWHNGVPIPEATDAMLVLTDVGPGDGGIYSVTVSNLVGFADASTPLKILGAPVILIQPVNTVGSVDSLATFSVTAEGALPLFYQWRFQRSGPASASGDVVALPVDIPGATNATLTLLNLTTNDAGLYSVRVSNAFGGVLSRAAELTVVDAGSFTDDFDPDIDLIQWLAFGGVVGDSLLATNYGGSVSGPNSLWFGGDDERSATTRPLNTLSGGGIFFAIRLADGSNEPWETADLPGEGVVFEYSVDNGSTWVEAARYDSSQYTSWSKVGMSIPSGAQSQATLFRWRQNNHSGSCCDHWALDDVAITTGPTPPVILGQPRNQIALYGGTADFTVVASGSLPLGYQWRFNGVDLAGATNAMLVLTNVQGDAIGAYSVLVSNRYGAVLSKEATLELAVDDLAQFRVLTLTANHSRTLEINNLAGDDRGGIATSADQVFVTGDNATARYALSDLSGGARIGQSVQWNGMIADLRMQRVYLLGNEDTPLSNQGTVTTLLEIDGRTGLRTGRRIDLSQPIPATSSSSGIFSGYARGLIHTGTRAYSVEMPSGRVVDLGAMSSFNHNYSESWAYWGIAERVAGTNYIVFVENSTRIVRRRVPDGDREVVAEFDGLSDMASITVSIPAGRWYFHHEGSSQFFDGDECLGYADATFMVDPGIYPSRYEWGPVIPLRPVNTPFPVTLSAINTASQVITNFAGTVVLTARTLLGQEVPMEPAAVTNFVNGVWTGEVTIPQAAAGVTLVASDDSGIVGVSAAFDVASDFGAYASFEPDPVVVGFELTNTIQVVNTLPVTATGVRLTLPVPVGADLVRVSTSHGSCVNDGGVITCDLQDLGIGEVAPVTVVLRPAVPGLLTNTVTVSCNEPDPNLANNMVEAVATVLGPQLVIDDLAVTEGDTGTQQAAFTVRLLQTSTNTLTVQYATAFGSASTRDFTAASGTLTFPPNTTTQTLAVAIRGDALYEIDETFTVALSSPVNASLGRGTATCTILNNDTMPAVTVNDPVIVEGDTGTSNLVFAIRLSATAGVPVTVAYATSNGTATADSDYVPQDSSATFMPEFPGLLRNVSVPILGDVVAEPDETLVFDLVWVTNATLVRTQALGTIRDDDIKFVWDPIPSPQPFNTPFPVTLSARYFDDSLVSNFNGTVTLQGSQGRILTNTVGTGVTTNYFPMGVNYEQERTQIIYLASEIGPAGPITALALDVTQAPAISLGNWTIRMKHTALDYYNYPYQWEGAGWTVVHQGTASVTGVGWTTFNLTTPFPYNGSNNVMVDFSFDNNTTGLQGWCRTSSDAQYNTRTLWYQSYNGWYPLHPLQWSGDGSDGNSPWPNSHSRYPNARFIFDTLKSIPIAPVVSGSFTNGVWSGTVQVAQEEQNVELTATDARQHFGRSNPFAVQQVSAADLVLAMSAPTNAMPLGSNVTFTLVLQNLGPNIAPFPIVTNPIPPGLAFVSATTSRGSVTNLGDRVQFSMFNLPVDTQADLTVTFRPTTEGTVTNRAAAGSSVNDPVPANNVAEFPLAVLCADCDRDGMLDAWEREHGLDPAEAGDADQDADGDGMTNLEEFWAGTDPNDRQDVLSLAIEHPAGSPDVTIAFTGKPGRKYALERRNALDAPWVTIAVFKLGSVATVHLTDFGAAQDPMAYYRIRQLP
ncbi:MAG: DUF11 domain-containing protein [Verrucomicrobia bacterium]|nr:DUF11 domain-containing protein [Verrucomicrobiota bacterium]